MKTLIFLITTIFFFTGCSKDTESLSKNECKKMGYKYLAKKRLNYRTGQYEINTICKES